MAPLALKLKGPVPQPGSGSFHAVRMVISLLWTPRILDYVRSPEALQYPLSERSKRLMRHARVCGD